MRSGRGAKHTAHKKKIKQIKHKNVKSRVTDFAMLPGAAPKMYRAGN